ncbi:MAG: TetR/AcrR family transcriptional regulator [Clostridia bacterium]|nr:TetR/AcrR family transcriptional regulator [Clostridia bacterium]
MQTPSSDSALEKRRQILDASEHVFAENGFHTSTMDQVADAAGVAKGTIYLYFASKKELLSELVEDRIAKLTGLTESAISGVQDVPGKLRAIVGAHFQFYAQQREFMGLLTGQLGLVSPEVGTLVMKATASLTAMIQSVISEGIDSGAIHSMFNPTRLTFALQGLSHATAYEWMASDSHVPPEEVADEAYQVFIRGVRA